MRSCYRDFPILQADISYFHSGEDLPYILGMETVHQLVGRRAKDLGIELVALSRAVDRNPAYAQQFVSRGTPRELVESVRSKWAAILELPEDCLRDPADPKWKPWDGVSAGITPGVSEPERIPLDENNGNGYHDGWKPSLPGGLPQLDARVGAGDGSVGMVINIASGGITSGHLVTQEWVVPQSALGTSPARVFALPVDGTSMEPGLSTDDIVFVEPTERVKSGEIYVIDEGDGPMVKRLRIDRNEEPPRLWITSDNPAVPDFWRPLEAVRIIGQVIGKFVRMRSR